MHENRTVTRNATIFSSATLLSRLLGLVRTALIAGTFGTSLAASAFFFAYSIPNMLRRLSGEGALGGAFIPVFTEEMEKRGKLAALRVSNSVGLAVSTVLIALMLLITLILQSIGLLFPTSEKTALVVKLTQLMLPYLFFISLAGFGMAILNSLNHFLVPAISPAIHNVILIATLLFLCPLMGATKEEMIYGLAIGVLVGGAIQLGILYFPLKRKGYSLSAGVDFHAEGLKKILRLFLPGMFALAVTQVNAIMDKLLAFFVKGHAESAPSELFYGNLIVELPLAVFGVSLGVAVFPSLSRLRASGEMGQFRTTFSYALRQTMAIALPASAGLILLREPIIRLIYQRRAFGHAATEAVAPVMVGYALGLFAYTALKIIVPAFLSLQDARTPMKVGFRITVLNFAMNCFAVFVMKRVWGLALATSLSAAIQMGVLLYLLRGKIGAFGGRQIALSIVRIVLATVAMGAVTLLALAAARVMTPGSGVYARIIQVLFPVSCGLISYIIFCHLFKVKEVREVIVALRKRDMR
ncbi:murein biosynthesis integral membrane protein MurJ [bacterium]|nr:murein biosynthesis integral membrane protein MurJ [bacterium]